MNPPGPDSAAPPHLLGSLRQLGFTLLAMAQTRLALAGVEIEETLQWFLSVVISAAGVIVFGLVGLMTFTGMLVLIAEPAQRAGLLALFALVYLGLAGWFGWRIRRALGLRPAFLQATLVSMAKDREALQAATTSRNAGPHSSPHA